MRVLTWQHFPFLTYCLTSPSITTPQGLDTLPVSIIAYIAYCSLLSLYASSLYCLQFTLAAYKTISIIRQPRSDSPIHSRLFVKSSSSLSMVNKFYWGRDANIILACITARRRERIMNNSLHGCLLIASWLPRLNTASYNAQTGSYTSDLIMTSHQIRVSSSNRMYLPLGQVYTTERERDTYREKKTQLLSR